MKKILILLVFLFSSISVFANQETHNRFLGKEDAPVTIYEFSAIGCPYCAILNADTLSVIKEKYVNEGIVKLVFMDMPFNSHTHIFAHSILYTTKNNEDFFKLLSALFANQEKLKKESDVVTYAKLIGVSEKDIEMMKNNDIFKKQLLSKANHYRETLEIVGTPTLFITKTGDKLTKDSVKIVGASNITNIEKEIQGIIN